VRKDLQVRKEVGHGVGAGLIGRLPREGLRLP
jgi:hypothetical protein